MRITMMTWSAVSLGLSLITSAAVQAQEATPAPTEAPAAVEAPATTAAPAQVPGPVEAPAPAQAPAPAAATVAPAGTGPGPQSDAWNDPQFSAMESSLAEPDHKEHASWSAGWEMGFPVGDLKDYVSDPSYRGWGFDAVWPVFRGLRIGGTFHESFFHETKPKETYERESGAVTGKLYNYARVYSVAALAQYRFLAPDAKFRPFVGVELGAAFLTTNTFIADLGFQDTPNGFLFVGEAGGVAALGKSMFASMALRYNLTTADFGQINNPSFLALRFSVGWHLRR